MSYAWVGVDPGISGAVAMIHGDETVTFIDTPAIKVRVGQKDRSEYDFKIMAEAIEQLHSHCTFNNLTPRVVLEQVGTMPHDGRVGAFSFGKGYGAWQGILHAFNIPYTLASPLKWKRTFGILGGDKRESLRVAIEHFPSAAGRLARLKDNGRADALLLAEFGRRLK